MRPAPRRGLVPFVLTVIGALAMGGMGPASADDPPSIRLFAATSEVVAYRYGKRAWIDPATWVASVGGAFQLQAARPDYGAIDLVQVDASTGEVVRDLPEDVMQGWEGLAKFFRVTIKDEGGDLAFARTYSFCPNAGEVQRVDDSGPELPTYPFQCGGWNPLIRGTVWGIDAGWAVSPMAYGAALRPKIGPGHYTLRLFIKNPYPTLFDLAPSDAAVQIAVRVKKGGEGGGMEAPSRAAPGWEAQAGVPDDTSPDPATLPDLVALPAWGMSTDHRQGRDYLAFGATEWNEGPEQMVVEGFRQPGEDVMDAFQYFYQDGEPVGRAPVGTLVYHAGGGHDHWHFAQFTEYSLLDASKSEVLLSGKQSWCLVPTDSIDLTIERAEWRPWTLGLGSACGSQASIWVREVLDVGWGDTYFQLLAGQAFDITDVPNGTYFVKVHVNPQGALYEADTGNNVELRKIFLRGEPGSRRVVVPPWNGIDTESLVF